jgi:putative membrane protein
MFAKTVRMNALAFLLSGVVAGGIGCSSDDTTDTTGGSGGTGGSATGGGAGRDGSATGGAAGTAAGGAAGTAAGAAGTAAGAAGTAAGAAGTAAGGAAGAAAGGAGGGTADSGSDANDAAMGRADADASGGGGAGGGGATDAGRDSASDAPADALADLTDGQVAEVLRTANTGEIQEGDAELSRGVVTEIQDFAQQMVTDHTAANVRGAALFTANGITPAPSPISTMLNMNAMAQVTMLNSLTGIQVDRAYITGQVAAHQDVLTLIDTRLLPSADNAALRAELATSRAAVVMHLDHARMLQASLAEGGLTASDAGRRDAGTD